MRKHFCYILLLISYEIQSQGFSPCEIPPDLEVSYNDQIKILALGPMLNSGTADSNSIRILEPYYLPVFEALAAIYNSPFTEQVDSIFNIYCINNKYSDEFNSYRSNALYVSLDTTITWTESWEDNIDSSGNAFIDSLLFGVDYTVNPLFDNIKRLEFVEVLNLPALVRLLETVDGIVFAELVPSYGGGTYITHSQEGDDHNFKFILGWDDCQAGCISTRIWEFQSNTSKCEAQFLRSYGTPVTSWVNGPPFALNCNLKSSEFDPHNNIKVSIYPNPISDILHIESENDISFLEIVNIIGEPIVKKAVNGYVLNENISYLVPGIYVMILNKEIIAKFIKI
ncbi:MAG: T9SS type A sorting domain-containing protein [Saprospiraceae bacterium]|uniref:T9SS type A sorting domain-containing protein n=1 Tax=Candidatus Opimibacter skivensis TaxID=2982028 RepID=A0A9D7XQ01_9BACT|nr:T9SS type A sorting domain-containing protein [Candidatus Opimibacter skivensis]